MPTLSRKGGVRGLNNNIANPRRIGAASTFNGVTISGKPFRSDSFSTTNISIIGVTKDSSGVALGNCVVQLFQTSIDLLHQETTSDASGNYAFYPSVASPFYIVAYKAGAPDVAGTTVNTLVPIVT